MWLMTHTFNNGIRPEVKNSLDLMLSSKISARNKSISLFILIVTLTTFFYLYFLSPFTLYSREPHRKQITGKWQATTITQWQISREAIWQDCFWKEDVFVRLENELWDIIGTFWRQNNLYFHYLNSFAISSLSVGEKHALFLQQQFHVKWGCWCNLNRGTSKLNTNW